MVCADVLPGAMDSFIKHCITIGEADMTIARLARVGMAGIAGVLMVASSANADEFCCTCRGQAAGKTIAADDALSAGFDCSLACKRPTRPKPGTCAPAPAAAPVAAPAPAAVPAALALATGVLLYASEDCLGDVKSISASTPKLADQGITGIRSFSVASGLAVAFEKPGYAGASTQPVAATLCVAPGWEVEGIRFQGQ